MPGFFDAMGTKQGAEWEQLAGNVTQALEQIAEQTEPLTEIDRTLEEIRGAVVSIAESLLVMSSFFKNCESGAGGALSVEVKER